MLDEAPRAVKLILFAVLVVFALAVIVTTRNIFVANAPDVWENCALRLREIHDFSSSVPSKNDAAIKMNALVGEGATFIGNEIEPCGVGYLFNVSGTKYIICEDGSVSKYEVSCKTGGLYDKAKESLFTMKTSNLSQLSR